MQQWPSDPFEYDRKIWSPLCVFKHVSIKHDATNYVYWVCMALLQVSGIENSKLLKYFRHAVLKTSCTMAETMKKHAYKAMMNDVGVIFEALGAITNRDSQGCTCPQTLTYSPA
jgi:hypothetical protein